MIYISVLIHIIIRYLIIFFRNEEVVLNVFLSEPEFFYLIQTYWKKIESHRNKGIEVKVAFDEVVNLDNVSRYLIYCFGM